MTIEERMAIAETKLNYMISQLDKVSEQMDTLVKERHEGIGKKSMFLTVAAILGGMISHLISFFRQ